MYRPLNRLRRNRSHCGASAAAALRPGDQEGDLFRIERFVRFEPDIRTAANAADQLGELAANDLAAENLVVQTVIGQEMLVEEMAERAVADIVQQGRQPHQRLDVSAARRFPTNLAEAVIQHGHGPAG